MHVGDVMDIVMDYVFLTIVDRVNYSMVSRATQRFSSIETLLRYVSEQPVEPLHHFKFWRGMMQRCLRVDFTQLHLGDPYEFYLRHAKDTHQADCMSSGQLGEIMRDVGRTFPDHPLFAKTSPGEAMLARILKAIVSSRPDVGYCQGMNFIVGGLLIAKLQENDTTFALTEGNVTMVQEKQLRAEADVFWAVHYIMRKNADLNGMQSVGDSGVLEMETIWTTGFPKMKLRVYQFDRLFKWNIPDLHRHCEEITLSSEVLVSQWFMTLFSYTIPLEFTFRFWDYIFVGSWPSIYKVTLALLDILKDRLMDMDLEGVGLMKRDWNRGKFDVPVPSPTHVLQRAELFTVSEDTLLALQENFALEMMALSLKDRLSVDSSVRHSFHGGLLGNASTGGQAWLRSYYGDIPESVVRDMEQMHRELVDMENQVVKDKASMQKKILAACETCEQCHATLNSVIREEVKWLETTNEIIYQINKCHKKAVALTPAVQVNKDSIVKDTAANVVAPSEESELESQGIALGEAVGSSDSGDEGEAVNITEVEFEGEVEEEVQGGGYADDDDTLDECGSGSKCGGSKWSNRKRPGSSSSHPVSERSNCSLGTGTRVLRELSPPDTALDNDSCNSSSDSSGSARVADCNGSGRLSRSRSSSTSRGQGNVECHESTQDIFYRLMMSKATSSGIGIGNSDEVMMNRRKRDCSSSDSSQSASGPRADKHRPDPWTIDGGDLSPSSINTSPAQCTCTVESGPVPNTVGNEHNVVMVTDPEHTHQLVSSLVGMSLPASPSHAGSTDALPYHVDAASLGSCLREYDSSSGSDAKNRCQDQYRTESAMYERETYDQQSVLPPNGIDTNEGKKNKLINGPEVTPTDAVPPGRSSPKRYFRFGATLRDGMDMLFRATGSTGAAGVVGSPTNGSCKRDNKRQLKGGKNVTHIPGDGHTNSRLHISGLTTDSSKRYSRADARRKAEWEKECEKLRKRVAKLNKSLEAAQSQLAAATQSKHLALEADSESRMWKMKLCEQLQTFVQDSNRLRSQKLLYVAERCGM